MTFRSLSLLIPMRGQPERRARMWQSLRRMTLKTSPLQIVLRLDNDDPETLAWAQAQIPKPLILIGPRLQGYQSLPVYFNEMAEVATCDLLMCFNDDGVFCTRGWVEAFLEAANWYPDGVFNLGAFTYPAAVFPFSVVSRAAVQAMGFLNDERLIYSDMFLRDLMARFGRAILLPHIVIQHIGTATAEAQGVKLGINDYAEAYWRLHQQCVDEAAMKLRPLMERAA